MGELLIEAGVLDQLQLNQALEIQNNNGNGQKPIGELLMELGFVKEAQVIEAFATQYAFPYLPLARYDINPAAIDIVPARIAKDYRLMPVDRIRNILTVAMSEPLNLRAIEEVEAITKCHVRTFFSSSSEIKGAIDRYYKDNGDTKE